MKFNVGEQVKEVDSTATGVIVTSWDEPGQGPVYVVRLDKPAGWLDIRVEDKLVSLYGKSSNA
jgi:hypothetical protein